MMTPLLPLIARLAARLKVEPYLVGGTVRDEWLKRPSHDWDFVCRDAQKLARSVARTLSAHFVTLDEHFRIYRVVPRTEPGQIRNLTLDFAELQGRTIVEDLSRRDFTFNAMARKLGDTAVIDPFKGQKDLQNRTVRALSKRAFKEDPLRLLRAYRMQAQFEGRIEAKTQKWIASEAARLSDVAPERVREELLRLLSQPSCGPALRAMDAKGLLTGLFPELEAGRRVAIAYYGKGGVLKHHLQSVSNLEWLLQRLHRQQPILFLSDPVIASKVRAYVDSPLGGYPRSAYLKLGALIHDVGKPATAEVIRGRLRFFGHEYVGAQLAAKFLVRARYSRQEGILLQSWVRNHMRLGNLASAPELTEKAIARYFRDQGEEGVGMILLSLGDHYDYLAKARWGRCKDAVERAAKRLLDAYYTQRDTVLPPKIIDGHVLMKRLRLKPGPVIGKLLDAVRDAQAEGKVRTAEEALEFVKKLL